MLALIAAFVFALAFILALLGTSTGAVSLLYLPRPVPVRAPLRDLGRRAVAAAAVSRDHVISIRLTEGERRQLAARGPSVSASVREILRTLWAPPLPTGESIGRRLPRFVWADGTANEGNFSVTLEEADMGDA